MVRSELKGADYRVTATEIEVFGYIGGHHGERWILNMLFGDVNETMVLYETCPTPLSSQVSAVLAADTRAGRDHLIAYVVVSPSMAVSLFLEGILTFADFLKADEVPGDAIFLENVQIDGRAWMLVIAAEPDYAVSTSDAQGCVV